MPARATADRQRDTQAFALCSGIDLFAEGETSAKYLPMNEGVLPRGFAICTAPRSGSNFLSQLVASTGQLGRPREYFNGPGAISTIRTILTTGACRSTES